MLKGNIDTIDSLEASIHALIDAGRRLREERDRAYREADQARNKLRETQETVKGLRINLERMEKAGKNYHELEDKKSELINNIQSILSKLEHLHNIDSITND